MPVTWITGETCKLKAKETTWDRSYVLKIQKQTNNKHFLLIKPQKWFMEYYPQCFLNLCLLGETKSFYTHTHTHKWNLLEWND
jgi:hypothetical protein